MDFVTIDFEEPFQLEAGKPSTLFEIFIFCPKTQLWFPEKIVDFFLDQKLVKMVLDFLAVDNFDFTRKIVQKNVGEKLVKMLGFWQIWIFGQKFDFSNSVRAQLCTQETSNRVNCIILWNRIVEVKYEFASWMQFRTSTRSSRLPPAWLTYFFCGQHFDRRESQCHLSVFLTVDKPKKIFGYLLHS